MDLAGAQMVTPVQSSPTYVPSTEQADLAQERTPARTISSQQPAGPAQVTSQRRIWGMPIQIHSIQYGRIACPNLSSLADLALRRARLALLVDVIVASLTALLGAGVANRLNPTKPRDGAMTHVGAQLHRACEKCSRDAAMVLAARLQGIPDVALGGCL